MSISTTTATVGGGFGDGFPGSEPPFNFSIPPHPSRTTQNNTISVTSYVTVSSSTTTTFSTTLHETQTRSTIVTSVTPITIIPMETLAAQNAAIRSTAALTRTNTIIVSVLGGFIVLLMIALALIFCLWIRRRRRERDDNSPPFTSLAPQPAPQFATTSSQFAPQLPRHTFATSLSMGPRSAGYVPDSIALQGPNRNSFSRPFGAHGSPSPPPMTTQFQNLPAINVLPNTPSVFARVDSGPISPISQRSADRMPLYHESLQQEAAAARNRAEAENAGRLGLPIIERPRGHSVHGSVSTMGSDMGFEGGHREESRERDRPQFVHSTRASSGVFPEPRE